MRRLHFLEQKDSAIKYDLFVHGIKEETKEIIKHLGGTNNTSELLNQKFSKVKEWSLGRKPIAIKDLELLLNASDKKFRNKLEERIELKELRISCKYSPQKMFFPKTISPDLAYLIGLILGDGHVAEKTLNAKGNWIISVFFDNKEHQQVYCALIKQELGITPHNRKHKANCVVSTFASKAAHWLLRNYFCMHNGKKAPLIEIPEIILDSDETIKNALIQGLFDSDGTITKNGYVKYATTSKTMEKQLSTELDILGIVTKTNVWIKEAKYLPLYIISISKKSNKLFAEKIGFRHPLKKALLCQFI